MASIRYVQRKIRAMGLRCGFNVTTREFSISRRGAPGVHRTAFPDDALRIAATCVEDAQDALLAVVTELVEPEDRKLHYAEVLDAMAIRLNCWTASDRGLATHKLHYELYWVLRKAQQLAGALAEAVANEEKELIK